MGRARAVARLPLRDVKVRDKQTLLGVAWAVLQPLASMIVLSIVFGRLAHLASDDMPYPAFCLAGLLPWSLFASGMTQAANSLVGNVNLLTKVYFLRLLLPLSHVISALMDFAVSFVLLVVVLMCYGIVPGWGLVRLFARAASSGHGVRRRSMAGGADVQYRDVRHAMPLLVQLWMYGTPIVYSLSIVPAAWRPLVATNPLVAAVEMFRYAVLGTQGLSAAVVMVGSASAVFLLVTGLRYFRSFERLLTDTI